MESSGDDSSFSTPSSPVGERLDSWGEIASYLRRSVRTVRRWEQEEGLPVRRHLHHKSGSVYAFKAELDLWWKERSAHLGKGEKDSAQDWRKAGWGALAGALLTLGIVAAVGIWRYPTARPRAVSAPGIRSIAVLPLENISGDPHEDYLADGVTEQLTTELARSSPLRVLSRNSVLRYRHGQEPLNHIAQELNVDAVVEGSVQRSGTRLRISAQLIDARTDRHLWANSYDRNFRDILRVEADIARAIALEIRGKLNPLRPPAPAARVVDPEAYRLYLKGQYYWNRIPSTPGKGIEYFQKSIQKDPGYAPAHAALSLAYSTNGYIHPPREVFAKARIAAGKAFEMDASLPEAHIAAAEIKLLSDWDWPAAEREFQRALELDPRDAEAHLFYSSYLVMMGRFDQGIAEARRAVELDPISLSANTNLGWSYLQARQYDQAVAQHKQTLELDPNHWNARRQLARALTLEGKYQEASVELGKLEELRDDPYLAYLDAVSGRREEALKLIRDMAGQSQTHYRDPYLMAIPYAGLGDKDKAFEWLARAYRDRSASMPQLKVDPFLDRLRDDSRFSQLMRKMRFSTAP